MLGDLEETCGAFGIDTEQIATVFGGDSEEIVAAFGSDFDLAKDVVKLRRRTSNLGGENETGWCRDERKHQSLR